MRRISVNILRQKNWWYFNSVSVYLLSKIEMAIYFRQKENELRFDSKEKAVVGVRLRHVLRWFEKMCFKNRIWNVPLISTYKIQYCRLEFTFFENVLVSHSIYPGIRRPRGVAFLDPPSKLRLERESCASSYRTLDLSLDILVLGVLWK